MSTLPWSYARALVTAGALFTWGLSEQQTRRHAFPDRCGMHETADHCRRTHLPKALCGKAWAPFGPLCDDAAIAACATCVRLLESARGIA